MPGLHAGSEESGEGTKLSLGAARRPHTGRKCGPGQPPREHQRGQSEKAEKKL